MIWLPLSRINGFKQNLDLVTYEQYAPRIQNLSQAVSPGSAKPR
jgi:hypothetical protein